MTRPHASLGPALYGGHSTPAAAMFANRLYLTTGTLVSAEADANSHPDLITVTAVTINDDLLGCSSEGPGALLAQKPIWQLQATSPDRGVGGHSDA